MPIPLPPCVTLERTDTGLERLQVEAPLARATLYLQGAHLAHWQPRAAAPVLWMSRQSLLQPGKPIRGGVPICLPWFGPRADDPQAPLHGLARLRTWELESATQTPAGEVLLELSLPPDPQTRSLWPGGLQARFHVSIGAALTMSLRLRNSGAHACRVEEALHTYLAVEDVRQVRVHGLAGAAYTDKADAMRRKVQGPEPLTIVGETDRVYGDTTATCVLEDAGAGRRLSVEKSGSRTTVVWNPWVAKARAMPDFGDDEWTGMICIETANAGPDALVLAPGAEHAMTATLRR